MSFVINRVYTRSGDSGETGLVGGTRVKKNDPRVHAYGEVDELNAAVGMLKELLPPSCAEALQVIERIQQELFDLGSELATNPESEYPGMWKASPAEATRLEQLCDRFGEGLPELPSFILPGGSVSAAQCHIARTVARRAERSLVSLFDTLEPRHVNLEALKFLNRLSDFLFVLGRWVLAKEGKAAPLWVIAAKRDDSA